MANGYLYGRNRQKVEINDVVKQYEVYAGSEVKAGDLVEFINGLSTYGVATTSTQSLITSYDSDFTELEAIKINDTQVVYMFLHDYDTLKIGLLTVNGSSISRGSSFSFVGERTIGSASITVLNDNTLVMAYDESESTSSYGTYVRILSISGTTLSVVQTDTLWSQYSDATAIVATSEDQVVMIGGYKNGEQLYGKTLRIKDQQVVQKGSNVVLYSSTNERQRLYRVAQDKVLATYRMSNSRVTARLLEIQGMTLSEISSVSVGSTDSKYHDVAQLSDNSFVVCNQEAAGVACYHVTVTDNELSSKPLMLTSSLGSNSTEICALDSQTMMGMNNKAAYVLKLDGTSLQVGTGYSWVTNSDFEAQPNRGIAIAAVNPYNVFALYHLIDNVTSSSNYEKIYYNMFGVDNGIVSAAVKKPVFTDQVRPVTSGKFAGIAITDGVGGDLYGAKDKVKVRTYIEPTHDLSKYVDKPTTDFYYNEQSIPVTIFVTNNTLHKCLYTNSGKNVLLWDMVEKDVYYINVGIDEFTDSGVTSPIILENITKGRRVQEIDICITRKDKICIVYRIDNITYLFVCTLTGEIISDSVILSTNDWSNIKIDALSDEKLVILYTDHIDIHMSIYHTNSTLLDDKVVNTFAMDGIFDVTVSDQNYIYIAYAAEEAHLESIPTKLNDYMPKVQSYDIVKWGTDLSKTTFNLTVGDKTRPIVIESGEGKFSASDNVEKFFQDKIDAAFGLYEVKCNVTTSNTGYILEFERADGVPNVEIMVSAPDSETDLYGKNMEVLMTSDSLKLATPDVKADGTTSNPGSGYNNALPLLNMFDMSSTMLNLDTPILQFAETTNLTFTYSINGISKTLSTSTTIANWFAEINRSEDKFHIEYFPTEDIIVLRGDSEITIDDNIGLFTRLGFTVQATPPASDDVHTSQSTYIAVYDYGNKNRFTWRILDSRMDSLEWIMNHGDVILHTYPTQSNEVQLRFFDGTTPFQEYIRSYTPPQSRPIALGVVRAADGRLFIAMSDQNATMLYNEDWSVFCEISNEPSQYIFPYLRVDDNIGIAFSDTNNPTALYHVVLSGRYDYLVRYYTVDGIRESKGAIIR